MSNHNIFYYFKKFSQGIILTILSIVIILYKKDDISIKLLLSETLPYSANSNNHTLLFKFDIPSSTSKQDDLETTETFSSSNDFDDYFSKSNLNEKDEIIGKFNVIYQDDTKQTNLENYAGNEFFDIDYEKLENIDYLRNNFYIEHNTQVTSQDFDAKKFLNTNLKIDTSTSGPKVLIFHTHANELYSDSDPQNLSEGIVGIGEKLKEQLQNYNIETIHHTGIYDINDGNIQRLGAYERVEKSIQKILQENPSIEVAIDLHRDGFDDPSKKFVTTIDDKKTAKIMFFNGLSKELKNNNLINLETLPNPNLHTNLAFSFNMQLMANTLYNNFTRKIYLKPYRFSLHMLPKSLLIEVGANTNTKEEAFNAVNPLALILKKVLLD